MVSQRSLFFAIISFIATESGAVPFHGFVYTSYSAGGFSKNASTVSLQEVAATGVRVIELMATYYVANTVNATLISPDAVASPTDADVRRALTDAKLAGLAVAMKPHIDSHDGIWRANIGTAFTTESQWASWFSNYTAFICHFASLAAGQGIVGFNVGTELDGTHHRESEWRAVIAAVRTILPGVPLWLGPNWEWNKQPGYQLVNFWDALDFLGVDMYAPLASHADPSLPEAIAGWAPIVANLSAFSIAHGGKQFIFAEIGYASYTNAAIDAPGCCTGPPDSATQATLYSSFFAAVWPQAFMGGVFWWAWPENQPGGEPCSTDFSIFAKPAADVVKAHYGGARGSLLGIAAATVTVYSDGNLAPAWMNWSYSATVDLNSTSLDRYPGHAASAAVTLNAQGGALALRSAEPVLVDSVNALAFDLRAPNQTNSYDISVFLCACDDCSTCTRLPLRPLDAYAPPSAPCTVPQTWGPAAHYRIPITDLVPAGSGVTSFSRLQIGADSQASFIVDNVVFT